MKYNPAEQIKFIEKETSTAPLIHIVKVIRKNLLWIFLAGVVAFGCAQYYFISNITFHSDVVFVVSGSPYLNDVNPGMADSHISDFISSNEGYNRIYQMLYSTNLMNHLITKFHLYKEQGLDSIQKYSYQNIFKVLLNSIRISRNINNVITVSVASQNKILAADMANEIGVKIDEMNKQYIVENIKRRIGIYETIINDIKDQAAVMSSRLDSSVTLLNETMRQVKDLRFMPEHILNLEQTILQIAAQLSEKSGALLQEHKVFRWSLESIQKENLPSIDVMQNAFVDDGSDMPHFWLYSLIISLFIMMILSFLIFQFQKNKMLLKEVFVKSNGKKL